MWMQRYEKILKDVSFWSGMSMGCLLYLITIKMTKSRRGTHC